jgi:hypothetical protein
MVSTVQDDPIARARVLQLDPRRNGWLIAAVERPEIVVLQAHGDALIAIAPDDSARLADPCSVHGAELLGRATTALDLREVTGPTAAVAAFVAARSDASAWRSSATFIEMAFSAPALARAVAGELRHSSVGSHRRWRSRT